MYPEMNKQQMPSAPPSYSDSLNAPKYAPNPQHSTSNYPTQPSLGFQDPNTQVIVVQVPGIPPLGPQPVQLTCPTCKANVMSSVEEDSSNSAYLCCMLMFVVGCCFCSCLPFCMDNFKNFKHSCPRCNAFIGSYNP